MPTTGSSLTCTSHVLRMYPEHQVMTIAWYAAGVRVIDLSGLVGVSVGATNETGSQGVGMRQIGYLYFGDSDTWSAKAPRIESDGSMWIYGNDINRGLDVYRFDATAPPPEGIDVGRWLTPEQAQVELAGVVAPVSPSNQPYCLLPAGTA